MLLGDETWNANGAQPIEMSANDSGSDLGPIGTPKSIGLDGARYSCPAKDAAGAKAEVRSGVLQFDYEQERFGFEAPRFFIRCDVSYRRTPTRWAAEWLAKEPFELESRPVELQFEIMNSSPRSTSGVS
ncbi:MAG: hypothetical protein U0164_12810 [Gemmatimonadaceae bacterium]